MAWTNFLVASLVGQNIRKFHHRIQFGRKKESLFLVFTFEFFHLGSSFKIGGIDNFTDLQGEKLEEIYGEFLLVLSLQLFMGVRNLLVLPFALQKFDPRARSWQGPSPVGKGRFCYNFAFIINGKCFFYILFQETHYA